MTMQRKWIQTATIAVDEETGAILVSGANGGAVEIVGLKNTDGDSINPATVEGLAAVLDELQAGGLPALGTDAEGADAHAKVLDCPDRVCRHLIALADANDAVLSLDGGATDHVVVPADGGLALDGLAVPPEAEVHARNASTGQNYANLRVMVW